MPKLGRIIPLVGLALGVGVLALLSLGAPDPSATARENFPSSSRIHAPNFGYSLRDPIFRGSTSCAAASCHGGGQVGKPGSEYTTWMEKDPHSRAYSVLFNEQSRHIAHAMQFVNKSKEIVPAHRDALCLKCHALNVEIPDRVSVESVLLESNSVPSREVFAAQGVGCESCHGGAGEWLTTHYQPSFLSKSRREKAEQHGMYPTKDLAFRASLCASCHIGSEQQEVNHDLFAAGHPPFRFEYTSFQSHPNYQRHWTEKNYGDDFEARAWAIGQVACARAAVDRLQARAEQAEKAKAPWPELSEYSCFACHKNLDPKGSWVPLTKTDRAPGTLAWGHATTPFLPLLAERGDTFGFGAKPSLAEVDKLRKLMEMPRPDAARVAQQSRTALKELDDWLGRLQQAAERDSQRRPLSREQIAQLFRDVAGHAVTPDGKLNDLDSDSAALYFDSLTALERAERRYSGKTAPRDLSRDLEALRNQVTPPPGFWSPRNLQPSEILKLFQQLRSAPLSSEPPP